MVSTFGKQVSEFEMSLGLMGANTMGNGMAASSMERGSTSVLTGLSERESG
jgi:hypothetical protein